MAYVDVFSGNVIRPAVVNYRAVSLTANTTLVWPTSQVVDGTNAVAEIMDVTPSGAGFSLTMPDAREAATGESVLFFNPGADTFSVLENDGAALTTVAAGQYRFIYLTDNTTQGGTWRVNAFGVGTSSPDAASLVGFGIKAIGGTLNQKQDIVETAVGITLASSDRAGLKVFTGGSVTCTLPLTTDVGSDFFVSLKNSGTGSVTVTPAGIEEIDEIDGGASLIMVPDESFILQSNGGGKWYTIGRGRSLTFAFSQLVKSVAGGLDVTLTSTETSNKIIQLVGLLTANINVIVPNVASIYWIFNNTTGAFTVTIKTAAGTGIPITQGTRAMLLCDAVNVVDADDNPSTTGLFADGNVGSPSMAFALDTDTGFYRPTTNTTGAAAGGVDSFRFKTAAAGVNYLTSTPGATTFAPTLAAEGADANIVLALTPKGTGGFAVGVGTVASGTDSIAIGTSADATDTAGIAIGSGAQVVPGGFSSDNGIAIGVSASVTPSAAATSNDAIAIGAGATSGRNSAISIGDGATASGLVSTAIGAATVAAGASSIAIGDTATTDTSGDNIAIGTAASSAASAAIAIGETSSASGTQSIAIGSDASASTTGSIAIGDNTVASTGTQAIAIGISADATAADAIALGENAQATSAQSIAIGSDAVASTAAATIAIGDNASATGADGIAIGEGSAAAGPQGVAVGSDASASLTACIAVGDGAQASATSATAIGLAAQATASRSVAIGATVVNAFADTFFTGNSQSAIFSGAMERSVEMTDTTTFASRSAEVILRKRTTNATVTTLLQADGSKLVIPASTVWHFDCQVVAQVEGLSEFLVHTFRDGVIRRDGAGNTTLTAPTVNTELLDTVTGGVSVAVTADDTDEELAFDVTGFAATNIDWVAYVRIRSVQVGA